VSSEEGVLEELLRLLRLIRLRLASGSAPHSIAHEIIMVEIVAKTLGVYDEIVDEIEEVKKMYVSIHVGESLAGRRLYEQRFQRLKRGAWRAARLGRHGP
jgi:hypothetical protein